MATLALACGGRGGTFSVQDTTFLFRRARIWRSASSLSQALTGHGLADGREIANNGLCALGKEENVSAYTLRMEYSIENPQAQISIFI